MCTQSYWDSHISRIFTRQMRHVGCYGQVIKGEVVAYNCRTCSTWVCPSCRVRCHKDHDVDGDNPIVPTRDHDPTAEFVFACGCLGMCAIADGVPPGLIVAEEDEAGDEYLPQEVALDLIDNDEFVNFICAQCMQENPWLMTERLDRCYNGELPPLPPGHRILPVWCAGQERDEVETAASAPSADGTSHFPYHGMLVPENCFAQYTCQCDACAPMFEKLLPGCHDAVAQPAIDLYIETKEPCSNCGARVESGAGFVCVTCELALGSAATAAPGAPRESIFLCADCHAHRARFHPAGHEFAPTDFDTLWQLFGVSLIRHMDPELQRWMVEHWNSADAKEIFFDYLRSSTDAKRLRDGEKGAGGDDDDDDGAVSEASSQRGPRHHTGSKSRKE